MFPSLKGLLDHRAEVDQVFLNSVWHLTNSVGLTYGLDVRTVELGIRTVGWLGDWLDSYSEVEIQ